MECDYNEELILNFKKFQEYLLEKYGIKSELDLDIFDNDVIGIYNYEDIDAIALLLKNDEVYSEYIFDTSYASNRIYLKIPLFRSEEIAKHFEPVVSKKTENSILIQDTKSKIQFWVDVWKEDEELYWDYNQQCFYTNNYSDQLMLHLQNNENLYFIVDEVVFENF